MSDLKTNLDQILLEKQAKIVPENIKKDVEIFGIIGTLEGGIDTSDATATADDIISPKVAYAKGQQLQGNIVESIEPSDSFSVTETFNTALSVQDVDPYNNLYVYISSNNLYIGYISNGALQPYSYSFTPHQLTERTSFILKQAKFSRVNSDTVIKLFICGYNSSDDTSDDALCIYYIEFNKQSMRIILTKSVSKKGFLDGQNPPVMMVVSPFLDMAIAVAWGSNNGGKIDMIGATYTSTSQTLTLQYSNRIEVVNFAYARTEHTANYATDIYNGKGIGYFLIGRDSSNSYTYALVFNMNADGTISYAGNVGQIRYYTNNGTYVYNGDLYNLSGSLLKSSVMSYSSDFGLVNVDNNLLISINDTLLMYDTSNDNCVQKDFSVNNCSINLIQNGTDVYAKQATTSNIYHIEPSEVRSVSLLRKSVTYYNTSNADITANDVVVNKVAYGANGKVIGTIDEIQSGVQIGIAGDCTVNDLSDQVGYVQIITTCSEDRLFRTGSKPTQHVDSDDMASTIGLTVDKIKVGETILGLTGTVEDVDDFIVVPEGETALSITDCIKQIPLLDTSNATDMSYMFEDCASLTTIPLLDTSNVTRMNSMFNGCASLTTIPLLNTSNATNMSSMFNGCASLTTIPLLDTSNVTDMSSMFRRCTLLMTIPLLNTSSVTSMSSMFLSCPSLSNDSLNNLLQMCINAVTFTSTKSLRYIGLSEEQIQKCTTLSNYQAFLDAGWTTGY